jgi:iron complex outermembrane receptor protein
MAGLGVGPAQAAESLDDSALALGEVVVTAQKRETDLQKTPIAISVMGGEELKARRVQSLTDLMDGSLPSLRVAPFFSRTSALAVGIRGIVPFDANQPSRDAGVGVYIDGVYLGRSQGLGAALFDIERIEVLKGPQGSLFGRNSTGGAVSIITRPPSGEFGLRQSAGIGNYGTHRAESHLDLPSWNNVAVKLDAVITKRDGTVENTLEGEEDFNQYDRKGFHAGVQWTPTDIFTARYDFDISKDKTTPFYVQLVERSATAPASAFAPLVEVQSDRAKAVDIGLPQQESVGDIWGHMLHLSWTPNDIYELRSITAYRSVEQDQWDNGIGAHSSAFRPNATFARYSLASLRQEQFSQEVQILGTFERFNFVGGAFYYHEKGGDDAWTPNTMQWNATGTVATRLPSLASGAATPFPDRASTATTDSLAAFGQATWTPPVLDDRLHLTAGARYTHDKKEGHLTKVNGATPVLGGVVGEIEFEDSWNRLDPMVTVAFDPTEELHLYARWGTAYRAGGANGRSVSYRTFDPETVSTVEAGLKAQFLDNRARINLAAYSTRYKDIQIDFNAANLGGSNRGTIETVNAAGVGKIKGFEADASLAIADGLTASLAYAYTKGDLPPADNPFDATPALVASYIVFTPKNAFTAALDYVRPMAHATFRAHIDGNIADGYRATSGVADFSDNSKLVNARISLGEIRLSDAGELEIAVWSRNLLNEAHLFYRGGMSPTFGRMGMFNEPRTYGVDATVRF